MRNREVGSELFVPECLRYTLLRRDPAVQRSKALDLAGSSHSHADHVWAIQSNDGKRGSEDFNEHLRKSCANAKGVLTSPVHQHLDETLLERRRRRSVKEILLAPVISYLNSLVNSNWPICAAGIRRCSTRYRSTSWYNQFHRRARSFDSIVVLRRATSCCCCWSVPTDDDVGHCYVPMTQMKQMFDSKVTRRENKNDGHSCSTAMLYLKNQDNGNCFGYDWRRGDVGVGRWTRNDQLEKTFTEANLNRERHLRHETLTNGLDSLRFNAGE